MMDNNRSLNPNKYKTDLKLNINIIYRYYEIQLNFFYHFNKCDGKMCTK